MKYIIAIDQGTTSSRVIIYDQNLVVVGTGQEEFHQYFPQASWVEHDLGEIWTSVKHSLEKAIQEASKVGFGVDKVAAIGITNQRETFGLWDRKSSEPCGKAIVWQCRRSSAICENLKKKKLAKKLSQITGLVADPYFSGTKLKWWLDSNKEIKKRAQAGELAFGTIDTFLIWKLSAGESHATDVSNASRTLMMDLAKCTWSKEALKILGIPLSLLPEIKSSNAEFGRTKNLGILPDGIPITGVLGDQQAALFGQACFKAGESKVTYGTGAFLLINTESKIKRSKNALSTVAWKIGNKTSYALEGSVFIAGAAVQWFRDGMGLVQSSSEIEALAETVPDSDGVYFIPALSGLGSPYWVPEARGQLGGLTRRSSKGHVARACLEGIAHSVADQFEGMIQDAKVKLKSIRADGGASRNAILLKTQADLLQVSVLRPVDIESTSRGAASMAALGVGLVTSLDELKSKNPVAFESRPVLKKSVAQGLRKIWKKRVKLCIEAA